MKNNELEKIFALLKQFEQVNNKTVNFIYVNANTYETLKELGELMYETSTDDLIEYYSKIQLAIDNNLEDGQIDVG